MAQTKTPSDTLNKGTDDSTGLQAELFVNDRAEAMIKYSQPFDQELSWLEYDLDSSKLDFVMEDGDIRNFGIPVDPGLAKYLQNAFQVLMILVDKDTSDNIGGDYYPLIIHRA